MSAIERDLSVTLVRHRAIFVRYARARLGSDDAAEDVVHDLWLRLQARQCAEAEDAMPYLYRALANAVTDYRRSGARAGRTFGATDVHDDAVAAAVHEEQPDGERVAVARNRLAWVEQVIRGLPAPAAFALQRSRIDGQTHREIAGSMGISISGVEKHLQRAYKALIAAQQSEADASLPGAGQ